MVRRTRISRRSRRQRKKSRSRKNLSKKRSRKSLMGGSRPDLNFPTSLDQVKILPFELGGSTGALLTSFNDNLFVLKKSRNNTQHIIEEFTANFIYKSLEVPVPKSKIYYEANGEVGILNEYLSPSKEIEPNYYQQVQQYFVIDCLLANWDVFGEDLDNVLVHEGTVYRIDNGGALRFRAQGQPKNNAFGESVNEIYTMRCKLSPKSPHCDIFASLSTDQVKAQIDFYYNKVNELVKQIGDMSLREILLRRNNWLKNWANTH